MAVQTLNKNTHLRIKLPSRGRLAFRVEASNPVTTYVVDADGLHKFDQGAGEIRAAGGFTNRREHHQTLRLPYPADWHLLIVNDRNDTVSVFYEIYY